MSRQLLTTFFVALFALATCCAADAQLMTLGVGLGGKAGGGLTTTTFDPSFINANGVLSGGNLTFTGTGGGVNNSIARSISSQASAKTFFEISDVVTGTSNTVAVGFVNSSEVNSNYLGQTTNSVGYFNSGQVYINGALITTIAAYTTSDVIDCAADYGGQKLWCRVTGGNWNNNGTANPATGTCPCISTTTMSAGPYYAAALVETSGKQWTGNFGGTSYAFTAPAGFGNQ